MATEVVLVGAGGFGRVAIDVVEAHNAAVADDVLTVLGVADDNPSVENLERLSVRGYPYLGTVAQLLDAAPCRRYVLAIGDPRAKTKVDGQFVGAGWRPVSVVHPAADLGSVVTIGEGTIICSGAQISTNVTLGRHVHLNPNTTIGHDTTLHDYVSVNPGAIVSGDVVVEVGALVGAGAIILQQLSVGAGSTIGAGSVVTKPVPAGVVVIGVPGVWR